MILRLGLRCSDDLDLCTVVLEAWAVSLQTSAMILHSGCVCSDSLKRGSCAQDAEGDVTQEQMEAYMQSKPRWDDPMNQMKDTT